MKILILIIFTFWTVPLVSQNIYTPSQGPGYRLQTYFSLKDGATTSIPYADWDIAFDVSPGGSGVFVNESVGVSFTEELDEVALYYSGATDFTDADTTQMQRIYNQEASWQRGAFNEMANPGDPFDLGWGEYSPLTHTVSGSRVFFLHLRDGSYKKVMIQSLAGGAYTFRYANLDGTQDTTQVVHKSDFAGKTLAYFSFASEQTIDAEPEYWDLLFTRYATPLYDEDLQAFIPYMVAGVLQNTGVEVARAVQVDPATVDYNDYLDAFQDSLNTIGYDWKRFDFQAGWQIPTDLVYFVKTPDGSIWKTQFLDFEGSSTGTSTMEVSYETILTSTEAIHRSVSGLSVYPNPVSQKQINIAFELQSQEGRAELSLINTLGQQLLRRPVAITRGLNVLQLPIEVEAGLYYLNLHIGDELISQLIIVK